MRAHLGRSGATPNRESLSPTNQKEWESRVTADRGEKEVGWREGMKGTLAPMVEKGNWRRLRRPNNSHLKPTGSMFGKELA